MRYFADLRCRAFKAKLTCSHRLPDTKATPSCIDRIIKASSNKNDVVLDPFAGCATACVSAESLDRQWIGIDLSPLAATLVKSRLQDEFKMFFELYHRTEIPNRTDLGSLPSYRTHKHQLFGKQPEGQAATGKAARAWKRSRSDDTCTVDRRIARRRARAGPDHLGQPATTLAWATLGVDSRGRADRATRLALLSACLASPCR